MTDESVTTQEYAAMLEAGKASWVQASDATWLALADKRQREQTAATVLAALMQANATMRAANDGRAFIGREELQSYAAEAVALTDALRAELAKGGGK